MASSSSSSGVPPGFRFHPTDEELLLYYLKKKISFEKFDLEVIREIDLNKVEPWDLQERCRIGSTPQNEWYFFSHKDRKYPTGSRTNRATTAGFWKATGRDKCIRTTYRKIGMRKTLVFYRGRAPHGQKTDWIMHEYRLEESDDDPQADDSDGWVICRVFKKKCFFKAGTGDGSTSQGAENPMTAVAVAESHDHSQALASSYYNIHQRQHLLLHHHQASNMYGKAEHGLHYLQMPPHHYSHVQVQDLLPNHRAAGYGFSVLPGDPAAMAKPYEAGLEVDPCEPVQHVGGGGDHGQNDHWAMLDAVEGRFSNAGAAAAVQQMGQIPQQQRGGEMDLWGYGK